MITLDIIIVNWNSGKQLYNCLTSIKKAQHHTFNLTRICVVDNASSDNSLIGTQNLDLPLEIINNKENKGFAYACNQGASKSRSNYILFLNPDAELYEDSLWKSLDFMENNPNNKDVGILGIQLIDEKLEISRSCARFPKPTFYYTKMFGLNKLLPSLFKSHFMTEWNHQETMKVDQVIGAFFLVRGSLFQDLGGFDERFFVYYEEVDFSFRAYKLGWKSIYLTDVQAFHKGGGTSEQVKARRLFYSIRSRIQYGYKHFNFISATILALMSAFIEPLSRFVFAASKRSWRDIPETYKAFKLLWQALPKLLLTKGRSE